MRLPSLLFTARRARPPRGLAALCLALGLAACTLTAAPTTPTTRPTATLLGGAIEIAGPRGYCVDPASTRETGDTAVALLGRCRFALAVEPALLTVSVGPAASAGVLSVGGPALTAYFTSPQGRATLSRSGRAGDVQVRAALSAGDAFLLNLQDRALGNYWRAVVGLNGRLVTISVNGTDTAPLAPATGRSLLDATLAALRRAN